MVRQLRLCLGVNRIEEDSRGVVMGLNSSKYEIREIESEKFTKSRFGLWQLNKSFLNVQLILFT